MNSTTIRRAHNVTAFIAVLAVLFSLFFQVNKGGPFGDINPFTVDPYDAVGSFAFQGALLVSLLTYARALRMRYDSAQAAKLRLVLRGDALVLAAIAITLVADAIAVILHPLPQSYWGHVLLLELVAMTLLGVGGIAALLVVARPGTAAELARDLTPADAIDDLWTLVRVPAKALGPILPRALVAWTQRFNSDRLFARVRWLNPRVHPWRFAFIAGLAAGLALAGAQLQEGLPPSLRIGLIVAAILISGELVTTVACFAILGGYLGLRPPLAGRG